MSDEHYFSLLQSQPLEVLRIAISALDDAYLPRSEKTSFAGKMKDDPACQKAKITSISLYNRLKVSPGTDKRSVAISTKKAMPKAIAILMLFRRAYGASLTFNKEGGIDYYIEQVGNDTARYRLGYREAKGGVIQLFRFHYWRDVPRFGSGEVSTGLLQLSQNFGNAASLRLTYKSPDVPEGSVPRLFEGTWVNRDGMITVTLIHESAGTMIGTIILYFRVPPNEYLGKSSYYCTYIKSHSSSRFPGHPTAGIGFLEHAANEADWKKDAPPSDLVRHQLTEKRLIVNQLSTTDTETGDIIGLIYSRLTGYYSGYLIHAKNELVRFRMQIYGDGSVSLRTQRTDEHQFHPYQGKTKIFGRGDYPHYFLVIDSDGTSNIFPTRLIFRIEEMEDTSGDTTWQISGGIRATMDYERPVIGMIQVTRHADETSTSQCQNFPMADARMPFYPSKSLQKEITENPQLVSFFLNEGNKTVFNDLLNFQRLYPTAIVSDLLPHDPLHHLITQDIYQLFHCYYVTYPTDKSMEKALAKEIVINRIPFRIWKNGVAEVTYHSGTYRGMAIYRDGNLLLVFTDTLRLQVLLSVPRPKRIDDGQQTVKRYNGAFSTVLDDNARIESRSCIFLRIDTEGDESDQSAYISFDKEDSLTKFNEWDAATEGALTNLQGPLMRGFRSAQSNTGNIPIPRNEELKKVYFNSARYLLFPAGKMVDILQKREAIVHLNQAYLHGFGRKMFRNQTITELLNEFSDGKMYNALQKIPSEQRELRALVQSLRDSPHDLNDIADQVLSIWGKDFPGEE